MSDTLKQKHMKWWRQVHIAAGCPAIVTDEQLSKFSGYTASLKAFIAGADNRRAVDMEALAKEIEAMAAAMSACDCDEEFGLLQAAAIVREWGKM